MKKLFIIISVVLICAGCSKNFDKINTNPKQPQDAPAETFLTSAQKGMVDIITSANVNRNVYRQYAQYWTNTTYPQESRYDLITRAIPANLWNAIYAGALKDCQLAKLAISKDALTADNTVKNAQTAIVDVWECYAYHVLLATFGNIPYSEALNDDKLQPKYDDALTVHKDLINRLTADIEKIEGGAGSFGNGDIIYHGDNASWAKFANTLKMKLALLIKDEAAFATTVGKTFTSNADNALFQYLGATPNNNPLSSDLFGAGLTSRKDFVAANTIVNMMRLEPITDTNGVVLNYVYDPRASKYFTNTGAFPSNSSGLYKGGTYGTSNSWTSNSKPSYALSSLSSPALIMDYQEVEFMLAEAAALGWASAAGTIKNHYEDGIKASCEYWGVSPSATATLLAHPKVNYDLLVTAGKSWKEIIGTQQWLAYYNRGFEGWTSWRRLDFPILNVPTGLTYGDIPVRWTYPVTEQTLNGANFNAASTAIGGDLVGTELYFDN